LRGIFRNFRNFYKNVQIHPEREFYIITTGKHWRYTAGDTIINKAKVRQVEMRMNHHLKQFNNMFRVGEGWGHRRRITGASTSTHVPPPATYGLRKDHKNGYPFSQGGSQ
jgi:hypothetical protein